MISVLMVWQQASVLTEFTTYSPVDGRPAPDNTEVRLWYAEDALYVGIRAYAPAGTVRATLAERDRIANDDWMAIHLDTFLDRRRSFVFAVNPFGVQADGMRSDVSAGPGVSRASLQAVDLSQDYVWQSKGRLLDDGYAVELRIPFKSIRYQAAGTQDWGVQIVRQIQRTGYQDTWAPTSRALQAFTPQSGYLRGMTGMKRGLVLDVTPTSVSSTTGRPATDGWKYGARGEFGGDVRWGITSNFTVNATANPDFSQVETDVGQIPGDVRFALFFPELRPFFVEGSEQFDAPNRLVNTRSIVQPLAALKLTGKIPRTDVGVMSAIDAPTSGRDGKTSPVFNIIRLRRDLGEQSTAGIVFTDRTEGARFNRVAGVDSRLQFAKVFSVDLRYAASITQPALYDLRCERWVVGPAAALLQRQLALDVRRLRESRGATRGPCFRRQLHGDPRWMARECAARAAARGIRPTALCAVCGAVEVRTRHAGVRSQRRTNDDDGGAEREHPAVAKGRRHADGHRGHGTGVLRNLDGAPS